MLKATLKDRERIIEILLLAFEKNKSVNYICRNDDARYKRIRLLMDYAFKVCSRFGKVFISDDRNACALVLFPDKKRTTLKSLIWDIKLILTVIGLSNASNILKRETQIKKHHPNIPFYYLWFIGVDPSNKRLGIGSGLLNAVLEDADKMGRPVYLETSTIENLPWYKRFGFKIYKELNFGYDLFLLNNLRSS